VIGFVPVFQSIMQRVVLLPVADHPPVDTRQQVCVQSVDVGCGKGAPGRGGILGLRYACSFDSLIYFATSLVFWMLKSKASDHQVNEPAVDVNWQDGFGHSALHVAVHAPLESRKAIVKLLLGAGADTTLRDEHGRTPVEDAEHNGAQSEFIELFTNAS